jgi:hypothetical protein
MTSWRRWLADELTRLAVLRLRRSHPDWAEAMRSEHAALAGRPEQLGWAFGSLRASLSMTALRDIYYPAVLALAVVAMALYQWSADESLFTLLILSGLSLALGWLRPKHLWTSGLALGAVVCAVNGFETLSGVRPAYEVHHHTWAHDLRWLSLVLPALVCSAVGGQIGQRFRA